MLPTGKSVDEIVLAPTISKALILSGTYFIMHPIKPIRNMMAFAVDNLHLSRTVPPIDSPLPLLPAVDFA